MATLTRSQRRSSLAGARMVKVGGAGASATGTRQTGMGWKSAIIGAVGGFVTGGPAGAVAGGLAGLTANGGAPPPPLPRPPIGGGMGAQPAQLATACPPGRIRVGSSCVDILALPPGGTPATVPVSGTMVSRGGGGAVIGAFGLPALQPAGISRTVLQCMRGMVLGKDNLCYPKAILGRRSTWRKWRQPPRPPVSSGDVAAIRRAERARNRVLELGKDVGLQLRKSPRKKGKK